MVTANVLVIDDSPTVRKLVELTFRGTGFKVELAASGTEGIELARRSSPDVVFLDFVLPDMRGIDVCEKLAQSARTAEIPVVVMSAKSDAVADMFRKYSSFVACLAKPSSSDDIRAAAEAALARRAVARSERRGAGDVRPTFKQKEAAAKAIYPIFREALAQIPEWFAELNGGAPAPFFARKLLSPEVVSRLIDVVAPHAAELTGGPSVRPRANGEAPKDATFSGEMTGWPVAGLITFFESSARTGELTFTIGERSTIAYVRGGEVILVTSRDPVEYLRHATSHRLGVVPPETMRAAQDEQRASGVPAFVTLAAAGYFPVGDLTEVLSGQGRRLLLDAMEARSAGFAWRDLAVLPAYVDAHGRHVSIVRNTLVFGKELGSAAGPPSLAQIALERLRADPSASSPDSAVFARARGFSSRVQQLTLTATERRVLALVDGDASGAEIAARAGMDVVEVTRTLARLSGVELLRLGEESRSKSSGAKPRSLMILEPDVDGFQRPLASLLRSRPEPIALVDLAGEVDLVGAVRRERPRAVLLNAAAGVPIEDAARRLRTHREVDGVALVAVLDAHMATQVPELTAAGFDTVLIKPVAYSDLERFLQ